jgi:nuclease HARBI1
MIQQERSFLFASLLDDDDDADDTLIIATYCWMSRGVQYIHPKIDLLNLSDTYARLLFRFTVAEMEQLISHLQLTDTISINNGSHTQKIPILEALAILLRRLVSRDPAHNIGQLFRRSRATISKIYRMTCIVISTKAKTHLTWKLPASVMQSYIDSIKTMCPLITDAIGFIDCTRVDISRPKRHQESAYCGYKHSHSLLFQGIMAPDGLFINLAGPVTGRHHDVFLLKKSSVKEHLRAQKVRVLADSGYPVTDELCSRIKYPMTPYDDELNLQIAKARVTVEWGFGRVKQLFPLIRTQDQLRVLQLPVGSLTICAVFFTNVRSCLDSRNQISDYFNCMPPTLLEYLS